jgi:hypothetical protein
MKRKGRYSIISPTKLVKDHIKEFNDLSKETEKEKEQQTVLKQEYLNEKKNRRRSFKESLSPKNIPLNEEDINELIFTEFSKVKYLTLIQVSNKNLFPSFEDLPVHEIKIDKEDFYLIQKIPYYKEVEKNNLSLLTDNMKLEFENIQVKEELKKCKI